MYSSHIARVPVPKVIHCRQRFVEGERSLSFGSLVLHGDHVCANTKRKSGQYPTELARTAKHRRRRASRAYTRDVVGIRSDTIDRHFDDDARGRFVYSFNLAPSAAMSNTFRRY